MLAIDVKPSPFNVKNESNNSLLKYVNPDHILPFQKFFIYTKQLFSIFHWIVWLYWYSLYHPVSELRLQMNILVFVFLIEFMDKSGPIIGELDLIGIHIEVE